MILDYHMHLRDPEERIAHTTSAVEPFVETAASRGSDEIGFAEVEYSPLGGVALEISTNGRCEPVGELYLDREFLEKAGLPITPASDAHVPANVGRGFEPAVELACSAGYETVTVFEGRQARQEPLG